ncbi:MAG: hypothetical protein H7330_17145 [Hymenobacteraceae bacterium]|nr:hypothetical protein [Hymenobacteraceae bacterium]
MKPLPLLLSGLLLLACPAVAQTAPADEPPAMLADVQDEVRTAHLKPLTRQSVTLKPATERAGAFVTLTADGLSFRISLTEVAKARSVSAKVQQKYTRALQHLRVVLKEGHPTIELNQPATRDLEHLLAAWALPRGRVAAITWHDQPITAYTVERYGGGPNQALYPEGQVFYFYERERAAGFYVYMNVPKPK